MRSGITWNDAIEYVTVMEGIGYCVTLELFTNHRGKGMYCYVSLWSRDYYGERSKLIDMIKRPVNPLVEGAIERTFFQLMVRAHTQWGGIHGDVAIAMVDEDGLGRTV